MKRIHILLLILVISLGLFVFFQANDRQEPPTPPAPNWLAKKYGPKHFSQNDEELIIRDFFHEERAGVFVDIGANHYRKNSTTFYLEKYLDWSGVAVDAICGFEKEYELYRTKTRFFCFYVSNRTDDKIDFYVNIQNKRVSTGVESLAKEQGPFEKEKIATITLNDLLQRTGVERFDFLSMDIELAEPPALEGFDILKYQPRLVCIEAHEQVRQQILDYFAKHHYVRIDTYDGLDPLNYYFAPQASDSATIMGKSKSERAK